MFGFSKQTLKENLEFIRYVWIDEWSGAPDSAIDSTGAFPVVPSTPASRSGSDSPMPLAASLARCKTFAPR
jgi:hypothetical protein